MSKKIIGIDCGLDGAIVLLDHAGNIYNEIAMPVVKLGKGRGYDIAATIEALSQYASDEWTVCVENPGKHAPGASGLWSMTRSFAIIETICVMHGFRYHEVTAQAWQKEFWSKPKMAKGQKFDTKAAARFAATKLWPGWTPDGNAKIREGKIDAALIAEYARRKNL